MKKLTLPLKQNNLLAFLISSSLLLLISIFSVNTLSNDSQYEAAKNQFKKAVNATVTEYEPAVAVRASGCLTCHAKISSNYITDFGYGSPYFFANPAEKINVGIFNGHIYGDFTAGPEKTGWLTADFQKNIIVPEAPINFNMEESAGDSLSDKSSYREALGSDSLAKYLRTLESKKNKPAPVIEKNKIFIGAPDAETLKDRFSLKPGDSIDLKYIKTDPDISPDLKGIELNKDGKYYTNTDQIVCDGDLFVNGILFLDRPVVVTETGCRIYSTGPVFIQGEITYDVPNKNNDKSNLQIVSSEAVFLGVGRKKCNTNTETDPFALRLLKTPALPSIFTRAKYIKNITPQEFMQYLYDTAALVPVEDSSCHDVTIGFSRLLLNAPVIHSRYSGKFKGLVIAEYALFWQGKTDLEFDPIFKEVSVLPLLKDSDYLRVE